MKIQLGMAEVTIPPHSLCSVLCWAAVVFASWMQLERRLGLWRFWALPHPPQGTFKKEGTLLRGWESW